MLNKHQIIKSLVRITIILSFLLASLDALATNKPNRPVIAASINPIYQIILSITKSQENSHLIIASNLSEHTYQMKPSDIKNIKDADLVFYISNDLESFIPRIASMAKGKKQKFWQLIKIPGLKILPQKNDASQDDIHIWLNPENAIKIAKFITLKISEIDPFRADEYQLNLKRFIKEITTTSNKIRTQMSEIKDRNYMVYHDGYAYFEDYFAIKETRSITSYEDQELTINDLTEISKLIKDKNVKCIFGEPGEEKNTAQNIANNFHIKFMILDLIGDKENYGLNKNGYDYILSNIASNIHSCLL
jgi:zinc transport system substrate-binding protein